MHRTHRTIGAAAPVSDAMFNTPASSTTVPAAARPSRPDAASMAAVHVADLQLVYEPSQRVLLHGVTLTLTAGQWLGLVGASGAGKTLTALTLAGALPSGVRVSGGAVDTGDIRRAMVFQHARSALNPSRRIGSQFDDVFGTLPSGGERSVTRRQRRQARAERSANWLAAVGLDDAGSYLPRFPFELSGGQCQRVLLALALAALDLDASDDDPQSLDRPALESKKTAVAPLLIADEPTAGLDAVSAAQVMQLLTALARRHGLGLLLITHDLTLALRHCDAVAVMDAGAVVEQRDAARFVDDACHPCSRALIEALIRTRAVSAPPVDGATTPASSNTSGTSAFSAASAMKATRETSAASAASTPRQGWFDVRQLTKRHPLRRNATSDVTQAAGIAEIAFTMARGDALAVVGRSGSGKSTLANLLARVTDADSGQILLDGIDLAAVPARHAAVAPWRHAVQLVMQDAHASLDPLATVEQNIDMSFAVRKRPSSIYRRASDVTLSRGSARVPPLEAPTPWQDLHAGDRTAALMEMVGLPSAMRGKYPAALSGGEATRVALARALAVSPTLLILDEVTSPLDLILRAELVARLAALRASADMALIVVSHDLHIVRQLCDSVAIIDGGRIVESGAIEAVFRDPRHAVTRALLAADMSAPGFDRST